jgi:hypothetical protein
MEFSMKTLSRFSCSNCQIVTFIAITICLSVFLPVVAQAATLYVDNSFVAPAPPRFDTIQGAVDAADPGDHILVAEGEYAGAYVDVEVRITGAGPDTVINAGNWRWNHGFSVRPEADGTEISHFAIQGLNRGIYIYKADNVEVENLTISDCPYGVFGNRSDKLKAVGLLITDTYQAIRIQNSDGAEIVDNFIVGVVMPPVDSAHADVILLFNANHCEVKGNDIYYVGEGVGGFKEEWYFGIAMLASGATVSYNEIEHNVVEVRVSDPMDGTYLRVAGFGMFEPGTTEPPLTRFNKVENNDFSRSTPPMEIHERLVDWNKFEDNE